MLNVKVVKWEDVSSRIIKRAGPGEAGDIGLAPHTAYDNFLLFRCFGITNTWAIVYCFLSISDTCWMESITVLYILNDILQ